MSMLYSTAPSLNDIAHLAEQALTEIPAELRALVADLVLRVEDFPDDTLCAELELESPFDLLGLYSGVDMITKSSRFQPSDVDQVFLYRRPILDYWCETGEELADIVRHVLIHEIGHHFGYSDEDMEAVEAATDGGHSR